LPADAWLCLLEIPSAGHRDDAQDLHALTFRVMSGSVVYFAGDDHGSAISGGMFERDE
jgi:hypothetical protein